MGVAILSIAFSAWLYMKKNDKPRRMADSCRWLLDSCKPPLLLGRNLPLHHPPIIFDGICKPIAWFDRHIIDGTMDGFAYVTNKASYAIRGFQSGKVQDVHLVVSHRAVVLGIITAICVL